MRTVGWVVLVLYCVIAGAAGKHSKESTELQQKFDAEFLGRKFVSKVPLGGYVQWQLENGVVAHRLIDTEYNLDGSTNYLVRTGTVENPGFFPASSHVQLQQITKIYPAGTAFWVIKNEIKKDRIELWLTAYNNGQQTVENYAKLKLMLKDGYQDTADYEELIARISVILRIERLEKLKALTADMRELDAQLEAAEARFKDSSTPVAQYEAAQQVQTLLQRILSDQMLYQQAGGRAIENTKYQQRLHEIQNELPSLQAKSRELAAQQLHQQLGENGNQLASLQERLERPLTSASEVESYKAALLRYLEAITSREDITHRMQQEQVALSDGELQIIQKARLRIPEFQNRISTSQTRIGLVDLDRQYKVLAARHNEMLDRLLQSLGTANEKNNREKLLATVEDMRQNRLKAQQLGSKTASGELNKLQDELSRLQR